MGIGNLRGFATLDPYNGDPIATCDRCGQAQNHSDLAFQYEYAGFDLINLRLLVCKRKCLDLPNPTLQAIVLPPDPLPIKDPRPPFWTLQSAASNTGNPPDPALNIIFTESGDPIIVESGEYLEID